MQTDTILLIVDVQNALLEAGPYNAGPFLESVQALAAFARRQDIPVCYVQHDGDREGDLVPGTNGWRIHPAIAPEEGEKVVRKRHNSAFKDTGLHSYLQDQGVSRIVLAGMQTEYCIDATCKSAFDLGYTVVIPKGCTTTFDNDFLSGERLTRYFEQRIWQGRFAQVLSLSDSIFPL